MGLYKTNHTRGYLLGRLFAILERAEQAYIGKSTERFEQNFYEIATKNPAAVFQQLMKLKKTYLSALTTKKIRLTLEQQITDITSHLEGYPNHLTLQDQARFALGYHDQRTSLRQQ